MNSDCLRCVARYLDPKSYLELKLVSKAYNESFTELDDHIVHSGYNIDKCCALGYMDVLHLMQLDNQLEKCIEAVCYAAEAGHLVVLQYFSKINVITRENVTYTWTL